MYLRRFGTILLLLFAAGCASNASDTAASTPGSDTNSEKQRDGASESPPRDDSSSDESNNGEDAGGRGEDNSGDSRVCSVEQSPNKFSESPKEYSLPPERCGTSFDAITKPRNAAIGYTLMELTGDDRPDLVVYSDDCSNAVGRDYWHVYRGTEDGFETQPVEYQLPTPLCETKWDATAKTLQASSVSYSLADLSGNGQQSLVVTGSECSEAIGGEHWIIYQPTEEGFSPQPTEWSLPAARCNTSFDGTSGSDALTYSLEDLNGSGQPSLVVFDDECAEAVGQKRWDRYVPTEEGFSPQPTAWSLPASRCSTSFDAPSQSNGDLTFGLQDVNSEGMSLIVYSDSCQQEVGAKRWDLYIPTEEGFSRRPEVMSLPASRCDQSFDAPGASGDLTYQATDLNCPGLRALVVTGDTCSEPVGKERWELYPLDDLSFESTAKDISLPATRCGTSFKRASKVGQDVSYAWTSLKNNSLPSLVVTDDSCSSKVGEDIWHVYEME